LKISSVKTMQAEQTYHLADGMISSNFFTQYLEPKMVGMTKCYEKLSQYWSDMHDEDGEPLEYKVFRVKNITDSEVEYSECWLLECDVGYIPVFVLSINTSSGYSMCRCGMDRELEECDDVKTEYTLDEIAVMLVQCGVNKDGFKDTITETLGKGIWIPLPKKKIQIKVKKLESIGNGMGALINLDWDKDAQQ
jgi:hypothetical protein